MTKHCHDLGVQTFIKYSCYHFPSIQLLGAYHDVFPRHTLALAAAVILIALYLDRVLISFLSPLTIMRAEACGERRVRISTVMARNGITSAKSTAV